MKSKGRPKKTRFIQNSPKIIRFSPRGRPGRPDEIDLKIDELEAIRLTDYTGLSQKQASNSMQVSQQTFSRILRQARQIMADALVNGKIIKIKEKAT